MEKLLNKSFDRDEFVDFYKNYKDLRGYLEDLIKDPHDEGTRMDIGYLLSGDPTKYAGVHADLIRGDTKKSLDAKVNELAGYIDKEGRIIEGYVEKNIISFLQSIETEQLYNIAITSQYCRTGIKEHDKKVDLLMILAKMQAIKEKNNVDLMKKYIAHKLEADGDAGLLDSFLSYTVGDEDYVQDTFNSYLQEAVRRLQEEFSTNGKLDRSKIVSYMRNNLETIKRYAEKEKDIDDKKDINDLRKATYLTLAEAVYPREKKEGDEQEDAARERRREERMGAGVPL